jgi:uncharacterized membrane protein YhaH (DUF805 family)
MTTHRQEPPLELPLYGATPRAALVRFFRKYATFTGRASRSEYWWWVLVSGLVPLLIQVASGIATGTWRLPLPPIPGAVSQLFAIAVLVPSIAVTWRRLHDTNRSGLWFFFGLIPILGWILLLLFTVQPANPNGQRFDRRPDEPTTPLV